MVQVSEYKANQFGARHLQTLLLFLAIVVSYAERVNVSVSLVAMTDQETTNPDFREFDWDERQKSYIISSFYWGYIVTQFPGAFMARKLGVKTSILIAILGSSLFNILIPFCITWGGWKIYCAIRVFQGLFQGFVFPSVHAHLAMWSPIDERNRLGGLSHTGIETGTILAMGLTGIIAASNLGWPGISYVYGGIGIVFCVIWIIFAENNPSDSRFISLEEKKYILASQASTDGETKEAIPIPWKAILTSGPYLSLLVVRVAQAWGSTTMQNQIPAYLHGVLDMNIKSNALYSSLSYISQWILSFVFILVAEIVLEKKWASLTVVRKVWNTIAMWIPAALLVGVGFLDANQKTLAITLLTLNVGLNGGQTIGSLLNTIDLSPNHAAILMGILNGFANIVPIITPLAVGVIVYDETDRKLWQIIFIIAAVSFFLGNLQFIIFASTDTQPWNDEGFLVKQDCERSINPKKNSLNNQSDLSYRRNSNNDKNKN